MDTIRTTSSLLHDGERRHSERRTTVALRRMVLPMVALFLFIGGREAYAQGVGIGATQFAPHGSAILELQSTTSGFLLPRMTTAQRNIINSGTILSGVMIYNSSTSSIDYYNGAWNSFAPLASPTFTGTVTVPTLSLTNPLTVANGGIGLTSGTSGGIPYFSSTSAIASSGLLTANALMIGGGAGAAPTVLGSLGTTTTVLHGNAGGAPSYSAVTFADYSGTSAATSATTGAMTVDMITDIITITPTGNCTFNAAAGGNIGQIVTFVITTSGTTSRTLTWGTNYRKTGTLATGTTTARFFAVTFRYIGGNIWMEIARTAVQT